MNREFSFFMSYQFRVGTGQAPRPGIRFFRDGLGLKGASGRRALSELLAPEVAKISLHEWLANLGLGLGFVSLRLQVRPRPGLSGGGDGGEGQCLFFP